MQAILTLPGASILSASQFIFFSCVYLESS